MAWLQVLQTLRDHRKTLAAADELDIALPHMMGLLVSFWLWALDNAPSGLLDDITPRMIARAAQWEGDPDHLVETLIGAGWIDKTEEGLEIHDWYEYAGKLIDRRKADAERARRKRAAAASESPEAEFDGRPTDVRSQSRVEQSRLKKKREATPSDEGKAPEAPTPTAQERRFDEFWQEYPKKVGKKAALGSWKRLKPDAALFAQIMEAVKTAKKSEQWQREGKRFVPNPATWLNQGRWDDEINEEVNTDGTGTNQQHTGEGTGSFALTGFKTIDDE